MKISCQSCQAKYTIADEKVLGKIVKIRCKKCSATIVINGNEAPAGGAASAGVYDYTAQGAGEQWTVNVADGDQRTMTSQEIADAYKSGAVTDETFCWKDGMGDWLPLREIEALYAAVTMGPRPSLAVDGGSQHDAADEQPTRIQQADLGSLFGGEAAPAPAPAPAAGNGGALFGGAAAAEASAARRAGGRGAAGQDLFGGAARAGTDDEVMTSAPVGAPLPHGAAGDKMTGERNENSVLFSLSALTNTVPKGAGSDAPLAGGEGSGLIDIRALGAGMAPKPEKRNKVDDIMNLAGGGAFTPSLAAPVLSAPSMEAPDYAAAAAVDGEAPQGGTNKTLLFAIIGGASLVVVTLLVVFFVVLKSPDEPTAKPTASASASSTTAATTATATTPTATATTPPPATTSAIASTAAPPDTAPTATASATATTTASTKPTATTTTTTTTTATVTATATTTAPANDAPPFNLEAAKVSLKSVAGGVQGCAKPGGPTGSGTVLVQFRPNGSVQTAQVQGSPFAGTPVGACVAGRFFGARVPPFSGAAPPLTKSFSIN